MSQGLTMSDTARVYVSVCTCRAPFLLKEDTHCIRRHISSATDSTILDKTRGTRSLETVKTWDGQFGDKRKRQIRLEVTRIHLIHAVLAKKDQRTRELFMVCKKCAGCLYLSVNGDDVDQSLLQVVPYTLERKRLWHKQKSWETGWWQASFPLKENNHSKFLSTCREKQQLLAEILFTKCERTCVKLQASHNSNQLHCKLWCQLTPLCHWV